MDKINAPCFQCPDRIVTDDTNCHTTCKAYKNFVDRNKRRKEYLSLDETEKYISDKKRTGRRKEKLMYDRHYS